MDEPDVRVGVPPSRQGTIHTGASWMCVAKYSAASSSRRNRSRLMPGDGSPDRYRGATCSSQARLYKAPTVSLTFGSRITRNRQRCIFPPLGAQTPASRIFRINSFGTGSGLSRRIDRVVRMISNRSAVFGAASGVAGWVMCLSAQNRGPGESIIEQRHARCTRSVFRDPRPTVLAGFLEGVFTKAQLAHLRDQKLQATKDRVTHV